MQAATAATIEYTDYPECERRIYPTENDIAFYKTYEFCEAEGALQVYSKPEGVGHKLSAIRQFAPNTIMPELHSIFTKTSEKSNRLTYYNCTTNLYITNNTAYWAKSLRESGIRTDSRISQLISLGFDIDCHEEGVPLYYSDGICKMLTTAIYNGVLPEGFVVNTGRGAAYWIFIDPVNPNNKHALKIYKRLHTKIRTMLKAEIVNWGDNFLRRNTTPVGKRHTVLLYCLSTACDYHQAASLEKAQLINSTFAEPLPDKEVAKIVSWVKHPFKDETIAEALGLTKEEFKNLRISTFKKKIDRSRQTHDGILYPVASSAADRKMLGVLIDHKVIPDYRIRNHRKIWEAAQKREAKKAIYDTIIELFDKEKLSIKQIAEKLKIGIDTVKRQAAIRGVDIVDEEKKRRMRRSLEMQALSGEGWSVKAIAELFKCHVATVYRALQEVIEQTAEELERSIRAAADRVVEHTNELKVKAVEAVEQMKNPFLPVLEKAELRLNLYARQKTIDRITKPFQDAGYLPATLALPRKQVVEGSNLSVAVRLGSDYQTVCSMDELLLDEFRPKRVDYSKANLWLAEPDDDPEDFEPDFPDDTAFQMSAECLGEYDDEVSSRW